MDIRRAALTGVHVHRYRCAARQSRAKPHDRRSFRLSRQGRKNRNTKVRPDLCIDAAILCIHRSMNKVREEITIRIAEHQREVIGAPFSSHFSIRQVDRSSNAVPERKVNREKGYIHREENIICVSNLIIVCPRTYDCLICSCFGMVVPRWRARRRQVPDNFKR